MHTLLKRFSGSVECGLVTISKIFLEKPTVFRSSSESDSEETLRGLYNFSKRPPRSPGPALSSFMYWPKHLLLKAFKFNTHRHKLIWFFISINCRPSTRFSRHVECSFVRPVGRFLLNGRTSLAHSPKNIRKT